MRTRSAFAAFLLYAMMASLLVPASPAYTAPGDFLFTFGEGILRDPLNSDFDAAGRVYVMDYGNDTARLFDNAGNLILSWEGSGVPYHPTFLNPHSLAVDPAQGIVYVANTPHLRIQYFDLDGNYIGEITTPRTEPPFNWYPSNLFVDSDGTLYVTDVQLWQVHVFDRNQQHLLSFGSPGTGPGQFAYPNGVTVDSAGDIYVTDQNRVQVFDSSGSFIRQWGAFGTGPGEFDLAGELVVDADRRVYVSDSFNHRIQVFDRFGTYMASIGSPGSGDGELTVPSGLSIDNSGTMLFVADMWNGRMQVFEAFPVTGGGSGSCSFEGFLPPVSLSKPFKAGSAVPVKFRADCPGGSSMEAALLISRDGTVLTPSSKGKSGSGGIFCQTETNGLFVYNLDTKPLDTGTWELSVILDDGSSHSISIELR